LEYDVFVGSRRKPVKTPDEQIIELLESALHELRAIKHKLFPPTPTAVWFNQENPMLPAVPGNILVFTGTIEPSGTAFPAGTNFSVISSDPAVSPTVDETGLIVTIPIPADLPAQTPPEVLTITWETSTFVPQPDSAPASLSATIALTIGTATPPPPTGTPQQVVFTQTQ
jgi:hypothetical protein